MARSPLVDGIQRGAVVGEEDHAGEHRRRRGQQSHARFRRYSERAFRADEQVDPIHAGAQEISGSVFGDSGQRDGAGFEIDRCPARHRELAAIGKHYAQRFHPTSRGAEFETARATGIGRNRSAEKGGILGGIGRIELAAALRGGLQIAQRNAGARDGIARVNFQAIELLDGEYPSALRHAAASDARSAAGNGDRNARRGSLAQCGGNFSFIRGDDQAGSAAAEAGSVLQIARGYTSRITGMISGRCEVSFMM